mmetsp:Transcript_166582/g.529353  ORF Transcript_166582/g.529353 Transcript_166582/m.529353 type:complete len:157 (-) Transcript_166582:132-602(-)
MLHRNQVSASFRRLAPRSSMHRLGSVDVTSRIGRSAEERQNCRTCAICRANSRSSPQLLPSDPWYQPEHRGTSWSTTTATKVEGFFDDAIRPALERALGRRYCALFGPAIALGLLSWGVAAVALTSDGQALIALAAVPAPCILAVGGMRYQAQKVQ